MGIAKYEERDDGSVRVSIRTNTMGVGTVFRSGNSSVTIPAVTSGEFGDVMGTDKSEGGMRSRPVMVPMSIAVPLYVSVLTGVLLVGGCRDSDLGKVSEALKFTAHTIGEVQTVVIEANRTGVLDDADTRRFLELCVKVNQAGQQATTVTRGLVKLQVEDRRRVADILTPIIMAVDEGLVIGLLGVKEPTRGRLRVMLGAIKSTLVTVQVVLEGGR